MATQQITTLQDASTKFNELWQYKAPLQTPFGNINTGLGQLDVGQNALRSITDNLRQNQLNTDFNITSLQNESSSLDSQFRNFINNQRGLTLTTFFPQQQLDQALKQVELQEAVNAAQNDYIQEHLEEQKKLNTSLIGLARDEFNLQENELNQARQLLLDRFNLAERTEQQKADQITAQNKLRSQQLADQTSLNNANFNNALRRAGLNLTQFQTAGANASTGLLRAGLQTSEQVARATALQEVLGQGGNIFQDKSRSFEKQLALNQSTARFQEAVGRASLGEESVDIQIEAANIRRREQALKAEQQLENIKQRQAKVDANVALFKEGLELDKRAKFLNLDLKEQKLALQKTKFNLQSEAKQGAITAEQNIKKTTSFLNKTMNILKKNQIELGFRASFNETIKRNQQRVNEINLRNQEERKRVTEVYRKQKAELNKKLYSAQKLKNTLEAKQNSILTINEALEQSKRILQGV